MRDTAICVADNLLLKDISDVTPWGDLVGNCPARIKAIRYFDQSSLWSCSIGIRFIFIPTLYAIIMLLMQESYSRADRKLSLPEYDM